MSIHPSLCLLGFSDKNFYLRLVFPMRASCSFVCRLFWFSHTTSVKQRCKLCKSWLNNFLPFHVPFSLSRTNHFPQRLVLKCAEHVISSQSEIRTQVYTKQQLKLALRIISVLISSTGRWEVHTVVTELQHCPLLFSLSDQDIAESKQNPSAFIACCVFRRL